jgi:hypothetical protein
VRYWLYKCNAVTPGPSGYWGDWGDIFSSKRTQVYGGSYSTTSPEVLHHLDETVAAGDVVVSYQTNIKSVVGFCRIERISGPAGARDLHLRPIEVLDPPLKIHDMKAGTILASSSAVNGPVMLRELTKAEMEELVTLAGAPRRVLRGQPGEARLPAAQAVTGGLAGLVSPSGP